MSVERKEYQATQVLRSVSPVRNGRSTQKLSQFDNNLDNLLQDLQSSVSTGGNSYSSTYKETRTTNGYDSSKNNSLNRVTNLKAANPATEYSSDDAYSYTSPDGSKSVKTFKKESYSYKSGGDSAEKFRGDFKINELDTLLDDLQQVKSSNFGKESYNSFGADPGFQTSKTVQREQRTEREGNVTKDINYSSEETYGRTLRQTTPSPTQSNTSTLSKQTKVTNLYPLEVNETITPTPDISADVLASLDSNLHPGSGNTKVTTTIKTYSYELPGAGGTTANTENVSYLLNESQTTPSKSFVYSKEENSASSKQNVAKYGEDSKWNFEERFFKESNTSSQPGLQPINISVKYQTHSETTKDVTNGYDEASEALMKPGPFPMEDDKTPVRMVEEVLAKIEERFPVGSYNASFVQQEVEIIEEKVEPVEPEKEIEIQKKEPLKEEPAKTKNVSGPPVYYPPGEMFVKKEEAVGWKNGLIAHEIEKFEYKAKEKSKTKGEAYAKSLRQTTPSPTQSNTSTLSRQTKVTNMQSFPVEVIETTKPDINPEVLASLDPNLHPTGNTKVIATIKSYSYEIPDSDSESFYSRAENHSSSKQSTLRYGEESKWNREERSYLKKSNASSQPPYQKPSSPIGTLDKSLLKETITTRNYQPGSPEMYRRTPTGKHTYLYNETTTTRNYNQNQNGFSDDHSHHAPPREQHPPKREIQTQTSVNFDYPKAANQTIVIKEETRTTTHPPKAQPKDVEVFAPQQRPPYGAGKPNEPVNITYKYHSHSSKENNFRGAGYTSGEESPLLQPRPFPKDGDEVASPPKRVEDLMATLGHEPATSPYNASFLQHEAEIQQQKKAEAFKQKQENEFQRKEPKDLPKTKNVTGPAVYYPPGHEMFAKKEESAAWRAEGAKAHEKGKYEYKAKEKSKSKGGSGAAIVPVCLPLCCGLPCTII